MTDDWLAERFEEHRAHLRAVAYRLLGSLSEADDAVQESWLRLSRADTSDVENMRAWLTTIVARVSLNMLRSRQTRREQQLEAGLPDPVISREDEVDPEYQALMADAVGLALLIVLDSLAPAERVAFVLHDLFGVPFEDVARIIERSPTATRQLASRARRRVQGAAPQSNVEVAGQRRVVDAFLAAARAGDFEALLAVLDPEIVLRSDSGAGALAIVRGAAAVARQAVTFAQYAQRAQPVLVNGVAGIVAWSTDGRPLSIMAFTVRDHSIVAIHSLADRARLGALDL